MLRIVEENLTGALGWAAAGLPAARYYVIDDPICDTGICKEFKTEAEAQEYITEQNRKEGIK